MESGIVEKFACSPKLCGSWISVNKSDDRADMVHLHIQEVRVYGSKWNQIFCSAWYIDLLNTHYGS